MTVEQHTPRPATVAQAITHYAPLIAEALPKHMDPDRFTRLALTTLRKTPLLQQCNPESFIGALLTASALGLEPDVNGECYLVPYKKECTLVVGFQGLSKMFWQHPLAARLSAEYVCANDTFEYDKGLNPYLTHKPATGDRGPVVAYYAIVGLKNGATWFDVFSPATIKALRGGKVGPDPRFKGGDPEHWMERKTALRQVIKLAPKATQLQLLDVVDERPGSMAIAAQVASRELPPAPDQPTEHIDTETGEVFEAEIVPDADMPDPTDTRDPWAEQAAGR